MALFRRGGSLDELITKLKNPAMIELDALDDVVQEVLSHPEATPKRVGFLLGADSPRVREAGFTWIAQASAVECADLMLAAIAAAPVQRRREMTGMFFRLASDVAGDALRRAFTVTNGKADLRAVVLEIVGYSSWSGTFLPLIKAALAPDAPQAVRRTAVRQLRRAGRDPNVGFLLREIAHDEDEGVRADALLALCDRPAPDMVELLFARLPHEKKDVQQVIFDALGKLAAEGLGKMDEQLFTVLADENPETRGMAAKLIGQLPDPVATLRRFLEWNRGLVHWLRERALEALMTIAPRLSEALAKLMFDPAPDVRMAAMLLAAKWNHASIVPYVSQIYERDMDWWTCSIAADILARFPTAQTFATLMKRVREPDLRFSVIHAMRAFALPQATEVLLGALGDPDRSVRCTALDGLRDRAHAGVVQAVFATAEEDPELQVRQKALETLRSFGAASRDMVAALELREGSPTTVADEQPIELEMQNPDLAAPPRG